MYIPEWEIEKAILWNPSLIEVPGILENLLFVDNQKYIKSIGRYIDVLFKNRDKYVIVEIKCVYIDQKSIILDQVLEYKKGLTEELGIPENDVICSLVTPSGFSDDVKALCEEKGIITKKIDVNSIISSIPKQNFLEAYFLKDNVNKIKNQKFDFKFIKDIYFTILKKRGVSSKNFSNLTLQRSHNNLLSKEFESINTWINSDIHDDLSKNRIAKIFKEISKNAPIRAHEVNSNSDGKLIDSCDIWFWLFYSVMDRRSNAATFVKAKNALETKDLFSPSKIVKLTKEKDETTTINKITKILRDSEFPLLRDNVMGESISKKYC